MKLSLDTLNSNILDELQPYAIAAGDVQFLSPAGHSHYPLLAHISESHDNCKFVDIGTHYGWSALALSKNKTNKVVTYDLVDLIAAYKTKNNVADKSIMDVHNIEFKQKNVLHDLHELTDAKLIFLDVDPHDGLQEQVIYEAIQTSGFRGILLCDDIHLNAGMRNFWQGIQLPKEDLTQFGHYSGTGLVHFNGKTA